MIEATGDLWTYPADWRVITTNGFVKKNGECVMGRGCAKEAAKKWPELPKALGDHIKKHGNTLGIDEERKLIFFPVKHNWWEKADVELIKANAVLLHNFFGKNRMWLDKTCVMPRPGCGNGGLKWEDVKPLLEVLPDNVTVITYG
jgi:hypothetical protein